MAKLNSGTIIYGNATVNSNLAVVGNIIVGAVGAISGAFHSVVGNINQISSGGAVYINTTGNILAAVGQFGSINSTGYINTTANISTAQLNAGQINTTGNVLAVSIVASSTTVNGIANVNLLNASGNLSVAGNTALYGNLTVGTIGVVSGAFHTVVGNITQITSGGTQYFNTTGNVLAAIYSGGSVNVSGNILSTGAIHNSLTVNGNINVPAGGNLLVGTPVSGYANAPLDVSVSANSYVQINIQNINTVGNIASSDIIATAPNGTDTANYIDMGINGNNWLAATWTISGSNDGYVYVNGGNLTLGTDTTSKTIRIHTGGTANTNVVAEYYAANVTMIGNVIPSTSNLFTLGDTTHWWAKAFTIAATAQYADLAENYTSDQDYAPGTVLVFGGSAEVTQSTSSHDPRIAGVVSTNPAYLMNGAYPGIPVALQGRVPCQVLGPVVKGDRLVASQTAGVAQRLNLELYEPGCIIGKSLEAIETSTISTIEVVVGRV